MAEIRYELQGNAPQWYERNNVPRILRPQAEAMFDHVSLHAGDSVLDLACGTGIVTRVAVEREKNLASIVGCDFAAGMLEVAQANTPRTDTPITWQQGDMCALPFPENCFDIVLCQQGLQFASDKLEALRNIRRVLRPDGRLAFTVWSEPILLTASAADVVGRHINEAAKANWLLPYAWADPAMIRQVVDEAGFQAIQMDIIVSTMRWPSGEDAIWDFIAVNAARSPFRHEITAARPVLVEEVRAAVEPYREDDEFVMLIRSHLVQAQTD